MVERVFATRVEIPSDVVKVSRKTGAAPEDGSHALERT
jgi:hypothetical protein